MKSLYPFDAIRRETVDFVSECYDLIIIGGGIYGIMLALEASRRGLKSLLLERDDFGSHTSFNHLRILHGGLRYLQYLDLPRFRESVAERSWFLRCFPHLAKPLDCLLPLYGDGFRRPSVFRAALALDALFAFDRNREIPSTNRLIAGRVLSPEAVKRLFPSVNKGVQGGALWQDGFAADSPRLLMELLRWACGYGAHALNYCRAEGLMLAAGKVRGVCARDLAGGRELEFRAPVVLNAAGPWSRAFAATVDKDRPEIFPSRVLVWNLLFNRQPLASCAVAVTPPNGSHTYFMPPWKGRLLVGTGHLPLATGEHRPPSDVEIFAMIDDLNAAVPDIQLTMSDLRRVFWGVMPGSGGERLASRPVVVDHGSEGGPCGFYSISGVKFTTARGVANHLLHRLFPQRTPKSYGAGSFEPLRSVDQRGLGLMKGSISDFQTLIRDESVMTLSDIVLRRTDIGDDMDSSDADLERISAAFPWDKSRRADEISRVKSELRSGYKLESGSRTASIGRCRSFC